MNGGKAWWIGFALIVLFVFLGELALAFREYVFDRLGLSRNIVFIVLWVLPVVASFIAVFFTDRNRVAIGFSFVPVLGFLGPLGHFIAGGLGVPIDFAGAPGLKVTVPIYLGISLLTSGLGTGAAFIAKRPVATMR